MPMMGTLAKTGTTSMEMPCIPAYWDVGAVLAFHETCLKMMEQYKTVWYCCEMTNTYPKHIIALYRDVSTVKRHDSRESCLFL